MALLDLALVIPAYNEEACIADVVSEWLTTLEALGMSFKIMVFDDGSTDDTAGVLSKFASDPRVAIVTKHNSGHGPTILLGYRAAAKDATWVFQCDADDEMSADSFGRLWEMRERYDALFGTREDRAQSAGRRVISSVSRLVVGLAYAPGVNDVNTPYRLLRSSILAQIVSAIPDTTFAPNLVVSGTVAVAGLRVANIGVPHRSRRTGSVSIAKWRLWRSAARSLVQTVALAPSMRTIARHLKAEAMAESPAS